MRGGLHSCSSSSSRIARPAWPETIARVRQVQLPWGTATAFSISADSTPLPRIPPIPLLFFGSVFFPASLPSDGSLPEPNPPPPLPLTRDRTGSSPSTAPVVPAPSPRRSEQLAPPYFLRTASPSSSIGSARKLNSVHPVGSTTFSSAGGRLMFGCCTIAYAI